jgi:hypothetical protein
MARSTPRSARYRGSSVAADAGDCLLLASDIARDLGERRARVEHRKLFSEPADRVQRSKQFVAVKIDKAAVLGLRCRFDRRLGH